MESLLNNNTSEDIMNDGKANIDCENNSGKVNHHLCITMALQKIPPMEIGFIKPIVTISVVMDKVETVAVVVETEARLEQTTLNQKMETSTCH